MFCCVSKGYFFVSSYVLVDNLSKMFIALTFFVFVFIKNVLICMQQDLSNLAILFIAMAFFCCINIVVVILSFEILLAPIILVGMCWGYQKERLHAIIYLAMFTLAMSLPSLFNIFIEICFYQNLNVMANVAYALTRLMQNIIMAMFLVMLFMILLIILTIQNKINCLLIESVDASTIIMTKYDHSFCRCILK